MFEHLNEIYPFESNYMDIDGFNYHYLDEGEGEPVIMVHGNPSWSIYYRNIVNKLKDRYRCIVPDHIGCGLSEKPSAIDYDYKIKSRFDNLEEFINKLDLKEPITLIVHDWGGAIGFSYATKYPEKIKKIVVLNTAAFHLPSTKKLPFLLKLGRDMKLGEFLTLNFNAFSVGASVIGCKRNPMSKEMKFAYQYPYNSRNNRIATSKFVQNIPLEPHEEGYDLITNMQDKLELLKDKPMLICWGEKDFVFDNHFLGEWLKRFPDADLHKFPDCGHYILEDAAEEVVSLVNNFVDKKEVVVK